MPIVSRKDWGAEPPNGPYSSMPARVAGAKVHYTGTRESPAMPRYHKLCPARVRSIQRGHMEGNGWTDIGYSFIVCPHGVIYEGRGLGNVPAANGAGLNSGHYAVLGLVGNAGYTTPSIPMLKGIRECIRYIRKWGKTGKEVLGHRDGYATDCPGPLYEYVRNGTLNPDNPFPYEDDEMPNYLSLGLDKDQPLELVAGDWTTLAFDVEYADPDKQHANGRFPSFLSGKARFTLTLTVILSGLLPGVEGQIRLFEVNSDGKVDKQYGIQEWVASRGMTYVHHSCVGTVDEGNKLRAEIVQFGDTPAEITKCSVKVLYWK